MTERFDNPDYAQAVAWTKLNEALGALAAAYQVDGDAYNEIVGTVAEDSINALQQREAA